MFDSLHRAASGHSREEGCRGQGESASFVFLSASNMIAKPGRPAVRSSAGAGSHLRLTRHDGQ
jgi:hypothetical protein